MDLKKFSKLNDAQQITMIVAMNVRNKMEDFHCKYLSEKQMKELNPIIRQAIWEVEDLVLMNRKKSNEMWAWLKIMIPNYWEVPPIKELVEKEKRKNKEALTISKKWEKRKK